MDDHRAPGERPRWVCVTLALVVEAVADSSAGRERDLAHGDDHVNADEVGSAAADPRRCDASGCCRLVAWLGC
jgi:hypothetical protein